MGCYETFYAPCPNCGANWESQSKLGACELREVRIGDIAPEFDDGKFQAKSDCFKCEIYPVIVIEGGKFVRVEMPSGRVPKEGLFGEVSPKY
jgi:hypothetical protein